MTLELHASDGTVVARLVDPPRPSVSPPLPDRQNPGELLLDPREFQIPYHLGDGICTLRLVPPQQGANPAPRPGEPARGGATLVIDTFHLISFATW